MSEMTDRDRANDLMGDLAEVMHYAEWRKTRDAIAAALAAEREKARAPFLALADELLADRYDVGTESSWSYTDGLRSAVDRIRYTAEVD